MEDEKLIKTQGAKPCYVGGQAVIEGVMMRGKNMYAMAVRNDKGTIVLEEQKIDSILKKSKFFALPIVRGVVSFVDSMVMGMKIITRSAEIAGLEDDTENPSKFEQFLTDKLGDKINDVFMGISVVIAIIISVGLFFMLPTAIGSLFNKIQFVADRNWLIGIIEGLIRLTIFMIYIILISHNKDIQRVFQYHGAEHKTINCLEHEEELTPSNVKKYSRLHRRCGTSFLLIVMVISMIFFLFVNTKSLPLRFASRILFVPLIAGVSYEVLRFSGKSQSKFMDIITYPGMKLQLLTTKEPDESQIECAIQAIQSVLEKDLKDEL